MTKYTSNPKYDQPVQYTIGIQGGMDQKWLTWFGGTQMKTQASGDSTFVVPVADQAELYGVLRKIRDSGLILVSINPLNV